MADKTQNTSAPARTYRCYKVLLDQFVPCKDKTGKVTDVLLPEKKIHTEIRRRHSVAVDQILRIAKANTEAEDALRYRLISVRCDLERIDPEKRPKGAPEGEKPIDDAVLYQSLNRTANEGTAEPNAEKDQTGVLSRNDLKKILAWNDKLARRQRQEKVLKVLFEQGFTLQKTDGTEQKFRPFLRSASMSRQGSLAFLAAELYDAVMAACTLGLHASKTGWSKECGLLLSKYNAYSGLALSDADRIDTMPCGVPLTEEDRTPDKLLLNEKSVIVLPDSIVWKFDLQKVPTDPVEADKTKTSAYPGRNGSEGLRWKADYPHNGQYVASATPQGKDKHDLLTLQAQEAKKAEPLSSPFDGEGLISPRAAKFLRQALAQSSGKDPAQFGSSFQIRLPFCKGMLHTVDFHGAMKTFGSMDDAPAYQETDQNGQADLWVTDLFGFRRNLRLAEIVLTKSMFKAATWLNVEANAQKDADGHLSTTGVREIAETQARAPWGNVPEGFQLHDPMQMYFRRCAQYNHALYLCRCSQRAHKNPYDFLNYQILATLEFDANGYRSILDPGVKALARLSQEGPESDAAKYRLLTHMDTPPAADVDGQIMQAGPSEEGTGADYFRQALRYAPQLLYSPMAQRMIQLQLERRKRDTMLGRIRIKGMTRYLSSDLMAFLNALFVNAALTHSRIQNPTRKLLSAPAHFSARGVVDATAAKKIFDFYTDHLALAELPVDTADVPGIAPEEQQAFLQLSRGEAKQSLVSVFRNPHMSSNEQTLLFLQSSQRQPEKAAAKDAFPETAASEQQGTSAPAALTPQQLRNQYLGRLDGICMLPARSRTATRLNGADFDGDIVRVITDAHYTEELYRCLTTLWEEEKPGFLKESALTEEDVQLDARPPQLPLIQMDLDHKDTTGVDLNNTDGLIKTDYNMFVTSMGNRIGLFSNQCIALHSSGKSLPDIQQDIRLYTTAVGCEIDAAKTNYMVDIPTSAASMGKPSSRPFLRFNADVKHGRRKSDVYGYYGADIQKELDHSTSQQGYALLQENNGFLDILPWYAHRSFTEQDALLLAGTIPEHERPVLNQHLLTPEQIAHVEWQSKHGVEKAVQLMIDEKAQQIPQDVVEACKTAMDAARKHRRELHQKQWYPALLWPEAAAAARAEFAPPEGTETSSASLGSNYLAWIRALFLAYNQLRKSRDSVSCDLDEAIRRILFVNFPEKNAEEREKDLQLLKDILQQFLPSDPDPADETNSATDKKMERLQQFCKTVTNYAFLLKTGDDSKTALKKALLELRMGSTPTEKQVRENNWEEDAVAFLDLCSKARRDGGYLLPYYAAQAVLNQSQNTTAAENEKIAEKAEASCEKQLTSTRQALEKAEKAAQKEKRHPQQENDADAAENAAAPKENSAERRSALMNSFASLSSLCFAGEDGDVQMPLDSIYGQKKLRAMAAKITKAFYPGYEDAQLQETLFHACLYLSDPSLNKNTSDFGCFFWDLCGPYALDCVSRSSRLKAPEENNQKDTDPAEIWRKIRATFEASLTTGQKTIPEPQPAIQKENEKEGEAR